MYFVFYFLAGLILFTFILIKFLEVILDTKGYKNAQHRVYAILLFLILITTFINIIIAIYSYRNTINMNGLPGKRGIKGNKGKRGRKGVCEDRCGQKVCYVNVIDQANKKFKEIFKEELKELNKRTYLKKNEIKIKNGFLLERINAICKSEQYQSIMLGKHPKKPNEKTLIDYISGIVDDWITHITKSNNDRDGDNTLLEESNKGIRFLLEPDWGEEMLNYEIDNSNYNTLTELKKYDIWNWSEGYVVKPKILEMITDNLEKPEPDTADLYIEKTNDYYHVFSSISNKDLWDDTKCHYGQMGADKTNPQNLSKCVFINDNFVKDYVNTWKTDVYKKPKPVSFFTPKPYTNDYGQKFYPLGSVWTGKATSDFPEKKTVLVSGRHSKPPKPITKKHLIWDSKAGCEKCFTQPLKIYRPEAPDGYICLGDIATNSDQLPINTDFRCVKKECVREKKLGTNFWNNKNVSYDKYNSYETYIAKTPYETDKSLSVSFWASGVDDKGSAEEQRNLYGLEISPDDGYNLFRANKGFKKPKDIKTYIIKDSCLQMGKGKEPSHPQFNVEKLTNFSGDSIYKSDEYFGQKPHFAILSCIVNKKEHLNYKGKPLRIYMIDDLNPRKEDEADTYFLATFNPKKNDFSNYITVSSNQKIVVTDKVDKTNDKHKWSIYYSGNKDQKDRGNGQTRTVDILSSYKKNRYLIHEYNQNGESIFNLKSNSDKKNWYYNTYYTEELPEKIDE